MKELTVACPFNASHRMQERRLQWHMLRCPKRTQLFHCKHNFKHCFKSLAEKDGHQLSCNSRTKLLRKHGDVVDLIVGTAGEAAIDLTG